MPHIGARNPSNSRYAILVAVKPGSNGYLELSPPTHMGGQLIDAVAPANDQSPDR